MLERWIPSSYREVGGDRNISKTKIEYCLWNYNVGRMDSSTDWGELYELGNRNIHRFIDKSFSIIPVSSVGKGKHRTFEQIKEDSRREHIRIMKEHEEFMKEHEIWKKEHGM